MPPKHSLGDEDKKQSNEEAENDTPPRSVPHPASSSSKDMVHLLQTSIKWNELIYEEVRKLNKRYRWMQVAGLLKTLIILIPFVIGLIYLIPFVEQLIGVYGSFLETVNPVLGEFRSGEGNFLEKVIQGGSVPKAQVDTIIKNLQKAGE